MRILTLGVLLTLSTVSCAEVVPYTSPKLVKPAYVRARPKPVSSPAVNITQDRSGIVVLAASEPVSSRSKTVTVRTTAYCPCAKCCGRMTGKTASGSTAWVPGVAADRSWLASGTKVYVPGYGESTVDDTGGRMKRKWWSDGVPRMDVRFKYHWEAREWGVKYLDVMVFPRLP